MSLFQKSVIKKYIHDLPKPSLHEAWDRFTAHFQNSRIQEQIVSLKEEEYQEGFVRDLFVRVLNYTLKPQPDFNLVLEQKSTTDSTKSDGAILSSEGMVLAVIELKDTNTTDLDRVERQAFSYKHQHRECQYVITSNFQKLRLYVQDAIDFEEFDLFHLDIDSFALLYCCLHKNSVQSDIPLRMKEQSSEDEEAVTKKLYADYSRFRTQLYGNISATNPQYNKLILFKKTQKLLDRFLFMLFAEDRMLLQPNSVRYILEKWEKMKDMDEYVPLYNGFKKFFGYLNKGFIGKDLEVYPYNGGLFADDEILDSIVIDDNLLYESCRGLSKYDFESEVDIKILGHILEHSLVEIEKIEKQLEADPEAIKDQEEIYKSKRKRDGVFYTPRYITKYVVESTIGILCTKKKEDFNIKDEQFTIQKHKRNKQKLLERLEEYRNWLLQLTICDPACGSGAFLIQALEYLMSEHEFIDTLKARVFGSGLISKDVESNILENNLYGVDINEEAVEIAKLSLWLRTAKKGRKLNDLSSNIKCGNSLIEDPRVAGDKSFDWRQEFPEVFEKGGFDVIIGNPPYLRVQGLRENFEKETSYFESNYYSATGRFDIYVLFIEKALNIINASGVMSFILPHKFMISDFGRGIRDFVVQNKAVSSIVSFGSEMVFEDASTYTCIINCSKPNDYILFTEIHPKELFSEFKFSLIPYTSLTSEKWVMQDDKNNEVLGKISKQPYTANDVFENISQGIVSVGDDIFIMKGDFKKNIFQGYSERLKKDVEIESSIMVPLLMGDDVKRYESIHAETYILYPHYEIKGKTIPYSEDKMMEIFPLAYAYISQFKDELVRKKIRYKTNPIYWYSLHRAREVSLFNQVKIITPETSLGANMTIDTNGSYHNTQVYSLVKRSSLSIDYKFLLAIMNSSLLWFYVRNTANVLRGGYFRFKTAFLLPFPFPDFNIIDQKPFILLRWIFCYQNIRKSLTLGFER